MISLKCGSVTSVMHPLTFCPQNIASITRAIGNALNPFDSIFLLCGIKTLAIRMDRQQATACIVAERLHQLGFHVKYPGLEHHPGRLLHESMASGPGAV